jgi:hypothetical protein
VVPGGDVGRFEVISYAVIETAAPAGAAKTVMAAIAAIARHAIGTRRLFVPEMIRTISLLLTPVRGGAAGKTQVQGRSRLILVSVSTSCLMSLPRTSV